VPWPRPSWIPAFHLWKSRLVFAAWLPVAYHCFQRGVQRTGRRRVLAISFLRCAFAAELLIVRLHRFAARAPAAAEGLFFSLPVAVWRGVPTRRA
jgi:hypothetical protein